MNTKDLEMQKIMNIAYEKWQTNKWSKDEFWNQLTMKEKTAVSLGNLNYQVCNGGFSQWYFNEYYELQINFLISLFEKISKEKHPLLSQVKELVLVAHNLIQGYEEEKNSNYDYEDDYEEQQYLEEELHKGLDQLDIQYYSLKEEDLLTEMNNFVINI
jgi:hypothetical protein